MRQRTIFSRMHNRRWPGCTTGNAFKKLVTVLFILILFNGCIVPVFATAEKNLEKVSIQPTLMQGVGILEKPISMDALVFSDSGMKSINEAKTIRTLTALLLLVMVVSLSGLLWTRIFVLRKEVTRKTSALFRRSKEITCSFSKKNGGFGLCFLKFIEQVISLQALKEKTDLENNRKHMESMSEELVAVVKQLSDDEERYQALTHTSMDGFWVVDKQGNLLEVNDAYCNISGYSREALLSMNIVDLVCEPQDNTAKRIGEVIESGWSRFEGCHRKSDGLVMHMQTNATWLAGKEVFLCFINDITNRKQAEAALVFQGNHDKLTGLYNRSFIEDEFRRINTIDNLPMTIAMGDVNGLKLINDAFGHFAGDEVLQRIAAVLKKGCREGDIIARFGGDEFVILFPRTDAVETEKIMLQITELLANEKARSMDISISFGCETKINEVENIQDLLMKAENHMYRHKLHESLSFRSKSINLMMQSLFEKSSREMMHSQRVSELCEKIALGLHLQADTIKDLKTAGLIHDIGKIGIADQILNSPNKLDGEEWKEIQRHPEIGYRILSAVNEFSEIANCVLEHHEWWDGTGYPRGLKGEEISWEARILAVADAYDAMTSCRTYGHRISNEEAIKEIRRYSGIQFDPEIARIFIEDVLGKEDVGQVAISRM